MGLFGIGLMPREEDYIASLSDMTTNLTEGARALVEMFGDEIGEAPKYSEHIKTIEHACDEITHQVSTSLQRSFITAIDREDVYALITTLDDVVDLIEALASAVVRYGVQEYTPYMRLFAGVIQHMAEALDRLVPAIERLRDIKNPLLKLRDLEREGDDLYRESIANLFDGSFKVQTVIVMKEIYDNLENTIDRCQHVGNLVERIVIKNM
jgi:predicted phosphate transport protein (TIGR00153 family)